MEARPQVQAAAGEELAMEWDVTIPPASLTIVGGQPTPESTPAKVEVPKGIERLLLKAAGDESFAQKLLTSRELALEEAALELNDAERATLDVVSDDALRTMIAAVSSNPRTGETS